MMEVEEYLQVDFEYLMLMVVEPSTIDDDDENFSTYVHHENSRMDYHEHSIIDSERNIEKIR